MDLQQQTEVPPDEPENQHLPEALSGQPADIDHLLPVTVPVTSGSAEPSNRTNVMAENTITTSIICQNNQTCRNSETGLGSCRRCQQADEKLSHSCAESCAQGRAFLRVFSLSCSSLTRF